MPNTMHDNNHYEEKLQALQIELVKFQRHLIKSNEKILVILEGRDAAGKDGAIKRITEHLSPRDTRVVALSKPSDREEKQWYFQRYVTHLPGPAEFVLFNRSWYNRAGVEPVMGFCTHHQHEEFLNTVPACEDMLGRSGICLLKYYLNISRDEQQRRLLERHNNPLKQWKVSSIDETAVSKWKEYSEARDSMLARTHHQSAPWTVIDSDDKKSARLNLIRHILKNLDYPEKKHHLLLTDPLIVREWAIGESLQLKS
jgi:polyphosphate kinase 2